MLENLKKKLSSLNDDEIQDLIIQTRKDRRISSRKPKKQKVAKKKKLSIDVSSLTPEQKLEMLKELEGDS